VERAGFRLNRGNTSWWGDADPRIENYSESLPGYHVNRHLFDQLLVDLAVRQGVAVAANHRAPRFDLDADIVEHDGGATRARFVVGASGRAGVLARQKKRIWDPRYRTVCLTSVIRGASGWDVNPRHALVEADENGWAWSAPMYDDARSVCFMLDPEATRNGIDAAFRAALEGTEHFRRLFSAGEIEEPWGRDASLYWAERYAGPGWLLAGDEGSFVDPLSSSGIKKALVSAWRGAVVVNTCLSNPAMMDAAVELFNSQEQQRWLDHDRQASRLFAEGAHVFGTPFWKARAQLPETLLYCDEELRLAFERIRRAAAMRLRLARPVTRELKPAIRGREVVLVERPVLPGLADVEYIEGVHLATVAGMEAEFTGIGEFYTAYTRLRGETPLPSFLSALALLVAKDVLRLEENPGQ
jgi:flavin-dependent dehydrogenase